MTSTFQAPGGTQAPPRPTVATEGALSTPRRFRIWSLIALAFIVLFGVISSIGAFIMTNSANRIVDNSAPVLIAVQDVQASLAEANSAATAAFLSGAQEDPQQRRLYEQAINRASSQIEETARLIGDDEGAHDSLKSLTTNLTRYSGLVEASRLANREGLDQAGDLLSEALSLTTNEMRSELDVVSAAARTQLGDDFDAPVVFFGLSLMALLVALAVLVILQIIMMRKTRRLLNLPLLAATILVIAAFGWMLVGVFNNDVEYSAATEGGSDQIELISQIQSTAYDFNTAQSLSLISGERFDQFDQDLAAERLEVNADRLSLFSAVQNGADSNREQAAANEMIVRWQRYRTESALVAELVDAGDDEAARQIAQGPAATAFVGFNTAVESVLLDNREQFTAGVDQARKSYDWLQYGMVVLPLLAALAALWGFQVRINEYR